ncbi:MAG: tetratricopeptide repeat protein [Burkholderiales bacterium]
MKKHLTQGFLVAIMSLAPITWALDSQPAGVDAVPTEGMVDFAKLAGLIGQDDGHALNVDAVNDIGLRWAMGHEGRQSFAQAMLWWKEAARRGHTVAMNNIGLLYAQGHGVQKDLTQAVDWWHQSAFLGNAWAMNYVGEFYENGLGVEQNLLMAMVWYKSAAERGEPMSMFNIGFLYEIGKGVEPDDAEAFSWYRKSAEKGYASAMHTLGTMYRDGRAVAADPIEALAWFSVANGRYPPQYSDEARENLEVMKNLLSNLSEAQRTRALERATIIETMTKPPKTAEPVALPGKNST